MKFVVNRRSGFTLVEIMIVCAVIGILAALAIPNFIRARENAQLKLIQNNLRILEGAKDQWAMEQKKGTGETTDMATISDYLKGGTLKPIVSETYTSEVVGRTPFAISPVTLGTYPAGSSITAY
ncbi:MAG TPA: type II secretion system protein [Verrucomicrobiae bacterium]|nr:type II secretion system protein [Verrucomicrobiae bacterium]